MDLGRFEGNAFGVTAKRPRTRKEANNMAVILEEVILPTQHTHAIPEKCPGCQGILYRLYEFEIVSSDPYAGFLHKYIPVYYCTGCHRFWRAK